MSEEAGEYKVSQEPVVNPPSEAAMKLANELMLAPNIGAAARRLEEVFFKDLAERVLLMRRIKVCLHRWASRFAASPHAVEHMKETVLLEQEIDEWILKQ